MKYKAAIFDLDGTLVDSIEDIAGSMNRVLHERQFPVHSLAAYKIFVGKGLLNLTRVSLPAAAQDEETVTACYERMQEIYDEHCTEKTKPYDGIIPLLNELKSRELKLAVFSNKADKFTRKIVQALMPGYFDIVTGMTTEKLKKPNPACALQISERFGTRPEQIIYLGDTGIDMQTAHNAKMYGVGVLWGFRTKEELLAAGAGAIVSRPLDLIGLL
jgi:phosphoglycolate phosphatase